MKTKYIIFSLFVLFASTPLNGQTERQNLSLFGNQQPVRKIFNDQQVEPVQHPPKGPIVLQKKNIEKKDTALFLSIVKRFGWYYGIGIPLTNAEAQRMPCYYRLTEKDTLGHFTHIEAVNGMGLYTEEHELSTYLIGRGNSNISNQESGWNQIVQSVVQLRLLPSSDSKHPSMESGYDSNGNQIYTYVLTQLNDSTIIGHYVDSFGEPISLLSGDNVAKYVQIVLDTLGYERSILYLDEKSYYKKNTDGAYMLKKDYDTNGNVVRAISCMMNGIPIKDDWGNCGWYARYNERGQILHKTYIDEEMHPIKMGRNIRASVDVTSRHFSYEAYRLTRESYFTETGLKDKTKEGVHCKEWKYDERGNVLCITTRDTANNLCNDRERVAQTFHTYDKIGNVVSTYYMNKDSLYVNDNKGVCLYVGKNTYKTTNGRDTLPIYQEFVAEGTTKTIDYKHGIIHVTKNNSSGKEIESLFFNLNMEPREHDGYYRKSTSYKKYPSQDIQESTLYSFHDTIHSATITDTKECTRLVQTYHNKTLLSSFGQTLTKDLNEITGQYGYDALGNIARSHLEDALYYKVNSGTTYRGSTSYMMGKNEYDEPSYISKSESSTADIYCTKLFEANNTTTLLDEYNKEIKDVKNFRDSLNKVYCIEVLNQNAYKLGLRSGDVIIKYADFYYAKAITDNWKPRDELQIETFLTRNTSKELLVLRYFPQEKRHRVQPISLPKGTPNEIGFLIQTVFYTRRESQRYDNLIRDYLDKTGIDPEDFVSDPNHYGSNVVCLLRPYKVSTSEMLSWRNGLQEDVVVVGVMNKLSNGSRTYVGIGDGFDRLWKQLTGDCDSTTVFYTSDGESLQKITLPGKNSAVARSFGHFPTKEYNILIKMEENVKIKNEKGIQTTNSTLTPEQAFRYIEKNTDSITNMHSEKGEDDFETGLSALGSVIDADLAGTGIESYSLLFISENSNLDDRALAETVLKKIDFSSFKSKKDENSSVYYKVDSDDKTKVSELVVINESFLFIIKGNFNYNE